MRTAVHDTVTVFRANKRLVEKAAAKAEREGMSLSELMRQALRREVKEAA